MVNAEINFPDKTNFKCDIVDLDTKEGHTIAALRFRTNSGYVILNFVDPCQVDAVVDCLLQYKSKQLIAGRISEPEC
jgi:hypothetical protein